MKSARTSAPCCPTCANPVPSSNVAECIVAKNRHGETGKVELRWMPEYTAFGTLETRYDEDE